MGKKHVWANVPLVGQLTRLGSSTWITAVCTLCGLMGVHLMLGSVVKGPWFLDEADTGLDTSAVPPVAAPRKKKKVIRRVVVRRPRPSGSSGAVHGTSGGAAASSRPDLSAPASGLVATRSADATSAAVDPSSASANSVATIVATSDDAKSQEPAEDEPVPGEVRRGARDRRQCGPSPTTKEENHRPEVHFLDAVLYVRLVTREQDANLLRWLQWARFAGVERVYLYDTGYKYSEGCAIDQDGVAELVSEGYVVIKKWDLAKWPSDRQLQIWQDVNRRFPTHHWRLYLDVDEYILAPNDTHSGFVKRYLMKIPQQVGVVQVHNFLFGGLDLMQYEVNVTAASHSLPERYFYRVPDEEAEADTNTKYIAHMSRTCSLSVYFARPCEGFKVRSTMPANLRFNHYNVRRTAGMKFKLIEDRLIEDNIAKASAAPMPKLPPGWREKAMGKVSKGKRESSGASEDEDANEKAPKSKGSGREKGEKRKCPTPPGKSAEKSHSPNAFFLDAAIYVRLTEKTPYALIMQWLLWLAFAGVERVYMYDIGYLSTDRCVSNVPGISKLVLSGFLVIKKWDLPKWPEDRQLHIWRDVNGRFPTAQWRMYLSIEEYIFSPTDQEKGFAKRFLERTAAQYGALQLQNFVFSGDLADLKNVKEESLYNGDVGLPEKHIKRVADSDASKDFRTKYIAHMQRTCALLIHTARPCDQFKLRKPTADKLRFNTYETSWQPDDAGDSEKLVEDRTMTAAFRRGVDTMNASLLYGDG